jgi:hypothetical protein
MAHWRIALACCCPSTDRCRKPDCPTRPDAVPGGTRGESEVFLRRYWRCGATSNCSGPRSTMARAYSGAGPVPPTQPPPLLRPVLERRSGGRGGRRSYGPAQSGSAPAGRRVAASAAAGDRDLRNKPQISAEELHPFAGGEVRAGICTRPRARSAGGAAATAPARSGLVAS